MKKTLRHIPRELFKSPISAEDLALLRNHAANVRLGASVVSQAIEKEHLIIYASMAELYKKYPEKKTAYVGCEEKTLRDMKLVMRYCVYSTALDDIDYANDRMFAWFRTILNAFEFGKEFIEDAYRIVQKRASSSMGTEESKALNKVIDSAIDTFNS